jgi:hypothetical protein
MKLYSFRILTFYAIKVSDTTYLVAF